MRLDLMARTACLALMLGAPACARNKTNDQVGAAQDSTSATARSDTTTDQTQSGVTDSSGRSTLGKDVEKTRPDQGQPVTSKGDTINPGVDSASVRQGGDTSSMRQGMDTTSPPGHGHHRHARDGQHAHAPGDGHHQHARDGQHPHPAGDGQHRHAAVTRGSQGRLGSRPDTVTSATGCPTSQATKFLGILILHATSGRKRRGHQAIGCRAVADPAVEILSPAIGDGR